LAGHGLHIEEGLTLPVDLLIQLPADLKCVNIVAHIELSIIYLDHNLLHRPVLITVPATPDNTTDDSNNANPQDEKNTLSLLLLLPPGKLVPGKLTPVLLFLFFSQTYPRKSK